MFEEDPGQVVPPQEVPLDDGPQEVTVFLIIHPDTDQVVGECSTQEFADLTAETFKRYSRNGDPATIAPRQAVKLGTVYLLLANDYGPKLALDGSRTTQEALLRRQALAKLTAEEVLVLGIKK